MRVLLRTLTLVLVMSPIAVPLAPALAQVTDKPIRPPLAPPRASPLPPAEALPAPTQPSSTATEPTMTADVQAAVDAAVADADASGFSGGVLVLVGDQVVVKRGLGPRFHEPLNQDEQGDITPDSLFEIASMSKAFTAIAILQLVQQGKLSLDDTLDKLFPDAFAERSSAGPVAVKHLLAHTSGLTGNSGISPYAEPSREAMLKKFAQSHGVRSPGRIWRYNNAAYCVLAAIIELKSGQDFRTYMREHVFDPAGMTSTAVLGDPRLLRSRAVYRSDEPKARSSVDFPCQWGYLGCGGVVTTLNDIIRFRDALESNVLIKPGLKATMFTPVMDTGRPGPSKTYYALGWFIDEQRTIEGARTPLRVHHGGRVYGAVSWWTWYPEQRVLVAVLGSGESDPMPTVKAIETALRPVMLQRRDVDKSAPSESK